MKKRKLWVISLGGSRIVPGNVDTAFIKRFRTMINSHPNHKFVIVTGGGSTARKYISSLKKLHKKTKQQSMSGVAITRFHAGFLMRIFGKKANEDVPKNMNKVKNLLLKNQVVFAGALRYQVKSTSDSTAAKLAAYLGCPLINLTDVKGLYTSNPKKNKKAKFIKRTTWRKFNNIAKKIKYRAGQHFVLDQGAAKIILQRRVPTYIVGSVTAINNIIKGKKFIGTLIKG